VLQIFTITFPFFALIAAGYLAAQRRMLPLNAIPGLNGFVLFFALPCMLYRFGATTPVAQLFDVSVFLVWGLCGLALVAAVVAFSRNGRIGWNDAAFGALVAAFPNTGFMGVPLVVALLGPQAAGPIIITLSFDMVVTSSLCIALSRLDGADQHGSAKAMKLALRGVVVNPLPWAIALGALAAAMHWTPPAPVWQTVSMLADAASPVALFTIGAVLARSAIQARNGAVRVDAALSPVDYLPVVIVKLIAHPLLVWAVGMVCIKAGLPLSSTALVAIVLVAALPSASNVAMLAERFDANNGRIARIILLTTVAAFFTFPLVAAWMR
jgi:malonate transporter